MFAFVLVFFPWRIKEWNNILYNALNMLWILEHIKCYLIWRFFFYFSISIIYILTTVLKTIMIMYYCCVIYLDNFFKKCQEYIKKLSSGVLMDNFGESNRGFFLEIIQIESCVIQKPLLLCKCIGWFCFDQNFLNKFTHFSLHVSNQYF